MAVFDARLKALEGRFFQHEQRLSLERHVERLVREGRLPESALRLIGAASTSHDSGTPVPTVVRKGRPEYVYEHKPGTRLDSHLLRSGSQFAAGTPVNMGRSRWMVDGASIFSVEDGRRLAQTPVKSTNTSWDAYESVRMNKIRKAALETPLVGGYRLLPEMTPGRALLWGTILAVWGTAAAVTITSKQLGIHSAEDAPEVLRATIGPWVCYFKHAVEPLRSWMSIKSASATGDDYTHSELSRRLRLQLGGR